MYTLMNKNRPLINFNLRYLDKSGQYAVEERKIYERPWFIRDLDQWLQNRHAPKHRGNIARLLNLLGVEHIKDMLHYSKGLSLVDTLWINCDDRYQWECINLYDHPFDETIAQIAFDGGLHKGPVSEGSPEFTTDGALAKCWTRRGTEISLMKQGRSNLAGNFGLEPYGEQYCCQVLDALGYQHVHYRVVLHRDRLASECRLLTTKNKMMLPLSACLEKHTYNSIVEFCTQNNMLHSLYQTVIFDYLVTNDDRHLNNIGVLMDADTFHILGLAPIYDNGAGLLPYAVENNLTSYAAAAEYAAGKRPRFYDSFYKAARLALKNTDPEPICKLLKFSFSRDDAYPLPDWRLSALEKYIRLQAKYLLDGTDPLEIIRKSMQ